MQSLNPRFLLIHVDTFMHIYIYLFLSEQFFVSMSFIEF